VKLLGCLPFLNVKPLIYSLERGGLPPGWALTYAPPSQLAALLRKGEIYAAPVSSFECLQNPSLSILPGVCIASHGAVKSVLLFSKKPVREIETVALDSGSLSGAAMVKIILAERYGLTPEFVVCDPDIDIMLESNDAGLLLGNAAMQVNLLRGHDLHVMDLGDEWLRLTGLPAVLAVWALTANAPLQELVPMLMTSKEQGMRSIKEIAREEYQKLGLPESLCYDYLTNVMVFDMGDREVEGLRAFGEKAYQHGLLDHPAELRFAQVESTVRGGEE
jgi:chorismate dehydratase